MKGASVLRGAGGTLLVLAIMVLAGTVAYMARALSDNVMFVTALTWVVAAPALLFLSTRALQITPADMGLRPPQERSRRPRYILGTLGGLVLVLIPALIGRLAGGYESMPPHEVAALTAPTGAAALSAVLFVVPALMIAAAGEELLFRGILLRLWEPLLGPKGALVLSALLFVAVHVGNPGAAPRGAIGVLLAGILLGSLFLARGDLWLVAGAHFGWNAGEALVLGVPVSGFTMPSMLRWEVAETDLWRGLLGGSFGPEEGLLFHGVLGLGAGAALVFAAIGGAFRPPD